MSSSEIEEFQQGFRIGEWRVNPQTNQVQRSGSAISLEPRKMDLLVYLAASQGKTVSKEEIFDAVWGEDTFVTDSTLWAAVSGLRQVLEEDPKNPKLIRTVPRRGYRLAGEVELSGQALSEAVAPLSKVSRWLFGAGVAAGLLLVVLVAWSTTTDSNDSVDVPPERSTVLLTAFDNHTGEDLLEGTLEVVVQSRLLDSERFRLVARPRVEGALRLMREPRDSRVSPELARRVALRDGGIDQVVIGRIDRLGSVYQVSVQVFDGRSWELLASGERNSQSLEDLLPEVNDLATWLVDEIAGEPLVGSKSIPERVTTSSLEALRLYTRGVEKYGTGQREEAITIFERAVELDPEFASAYLMLAWSRLQVESRDPSRITEDVKIFARRHHAGFENVITLSAWEAMTRAMELRHLTSESEQAFIQGCFYDWQSDLKKAAVFYELATDIEPEHDWAAINMRWAGLALRDRDIYAKSLVARARAIPLSPQQLVTIAGSLVDHGYLDLAAEAIQQARAVVSQLTPEDLVREDSSYILAWIETCDAWDAWRQGRYEEAVQATDRMAIKIAERIAEGMDSGETLHFLAALYLMQGRLSRAGEILKNYDLFTDSFSVSSPATLLAFLFESDTLLGRPLQVGSPGLRPAALLLFSPKTETEPTEVSRLKSLSEFSEPSDFKRVYPEVIQPLVSILRDHDVSSRTATVRRLQDLIASIDFRIYPPDPEFAARWLLARELDALGRSDEALLVRERIVEERNRTMAGGAIFWQKTAVELASSYQERGRTRDAERLRSELEKMLAFADPDHPILVQLR